MMRRGTVAQRGDAPTDGHRAVNADAWLIGEWEREVGRLMKQNAEMRSLLSECHTVLAELMRIVESKRG